MIAAPLELDPTPASLADRAYLAVRDRLIMLEIRPGEPMDDDRLAAVLGVGRTPHCMFLDRLSTLDTHVVAEHVALLRAIAAGEAERAEDLARDHVLGFERAVRAVI